MSRAPAAPTTEIIERPWWRSDEATGAMLGLVGYEVRRETIATWTDEECREAEEFALALRLAHGDKNDLTVPPVPDHVRGREAGYTLDLPGAGRGRR